MLKEAQQRMSIFQRRMREQGASLALLTDESSIVYLAGFWGYLGLVGAAPLSAEFCGLPQPASSRTAESTTRNSLRFLMSGPLDEESQDLSGVYSSSLCWSSLIFPSVTKADNSWDNLGQYPPHTTDTRPKALDLTR